MAGLPRRDHRRPCRAGAGRTGRAAQLAQRQVALDARADEEIKRLAVVRTDLEASLAAETASGQRWYQIASAWRFRAWDNLGMAKAQRALIIEAREGWANDRRGWWEEEPDSAAAARRPDWMGPAPGFVVTLPDLIPDPPGLEELLK